ncbi:MAG TPA: hypothetical protein VF175_08955 [Lacipirellula sp.]
MERRTTRSSLLRTVIGLLLLAPILLIILVYFSTSVSGTATLPNGIIATINGPFSASESGGRTVVDASGRQFVFTPTVITVDGKSVAKIDASLRQVAIEASFSDAQLIIDGKQIALP